MAAHIDLRISELLAARLCHELAGPITALTNAADILCEPGSEFDRESLGLLDESAQRASNRLQFYRFAYGFSGGSWSGIPASELATRYFLRSRLACNFAASVSGLPLPLQKLGCNLLICGAEILTRGGRLTLDIAGTGLRLEAEGDGASLTNEQSEALTLATPIADLGPRTVHAFFTGLLAGAEGWRLATEMPAPGRVYLTTVPSKP